MKELVELIDYFQPVQFLTLYIPKTTSYGKLRTFANTYNAIKKKHC